MSETSIRGIQAFNTIDGFWHPERVSRLRELHSSGFSNNQIARALGAKSRAAISGKLDRLGLKRETIAGQGLSRVSSTHVEKCVKEIKAGPPPALALVRGDDPVIEDNCDVIEPCIDRIPLLSAGNDQCRWPAADDGSATMVCGAKATTGPYCARHHFRSVQCPVSSRGEAAPA